MKKIVLAVFTCMALITAIYASNTNTTASEARITCYYVITVTNSAGMTVDSKTHAGTESSFDCIALAKNDFGYYKAKYPENEGYTVTLTRPGMVSQN